MQIITKFRLDGAHNYWDEIRTAEAPRFVAVGLQISPQDAI
jgi:hypothetical protein